MKRATRAKEDILQTACLLFAEYGYEAVSMRQIATEAKVNSGSLHYYFESKENLYGQVFRLVYDLDNALTYDVLLRQEPTILETPEGQAYAIQRVVVDYFHRHVFIPNGWKGKLIQLELVNHTPIFCRLVEEDLKEESEKMIEFYFKLRPDGDRNDAFYWAHLPDTQGLYYFMADSIIDHHFDRHFDRSDDHEDRTGFNGTVIKNTVKTMVFLLDLPIPPMLD